MLTSTTRSAAPSRRPWFRLGALALVMGASGLAAPSSVGITTAVASQAEPCVSTASGPSTARVGRGGGGTGQDPNSLTPAKAAAMDASLQKQVTGLQKQGTLDSSGDPSAKRTSTITIKTYVHVITRQDGIGRISAAQLRAQLQAINSGYAGQTSSASTSTYFRFAIASVDVTKNDDWYDWSIYTDTDNDEAKAALHRGSMDDLNIYITGLQDGLLGYATFPSARNLTDDGLVILNASMPGGTAAPYNQGDTATHEIGHWLGLFHTFEGGCTPPGDYVNDTPAQADGDNVFYCDESDDTCTQPGKDPVHNFMSYGDDPCLDRFTPGQAKRMTQAWFAYRSGR
jgi:hypothetical protein